MSKKVSIIDYGLGNLFSVAKAFEHIGANVSLAGKPEDIKNADYLILPGVGAFNKGIDELGKAGWIEPIKEFTKSGKPLWGICLGMQMLFDSSEENGSYTGLSLIKGKVVRIPSVAVDGAPLKVPHIGWTKITENNQHPQLSGIPENNSFYFVHSYHGICANDKNLAAYAVYGGHKITACVSNENIFACQFHPEKSSEFGLKLCQNFLNS